MNTGLRIVIVCGGLLLFMILSLASALRLDRALLQRFSGSRVSGEDGDADPWRR